MAQTYMSITGTAYMETSEDVFEWVPVGESGKFEAMQKTLAYYAENAKECDFKIMVETY